MFKNEYTLNVDIKRKQTAIVPTFVQNDTATLIFRIFDNGKLYDLTNFTRAEITTIRSDGQAVIGVGAIETTPLGHQVKYEYFGNEMQKEGFAQTTLTIFSNNTRVSIQPFKINIIADVREAIGATEEFGALQELVVTITDVILESREATAKAVDATTATLLATQEAIDAAQDVNASIANANQATAETLKAKQETEEATADANLATTNANNATNEANIAKDAAIAAIADTVVATDSAIIATQNANTSASNAQAIADNTSSAGVFMLGKVYKKNNLVLDNGSTWIALVDTQNNPLPVLPIRENMWWRLVAQRGVDGEGSVSSVNGTFPDVDGNVILDLGDSITMVDGFTPNEYGNVVSHTNKDILDKFSEEDGKPQYNGTPIGAVTSVNEQTGAVTGLETIAASDSKLANKVDKVSGKQLSTEDYTTIEKEKLAEIEAGAQVNTITSVNGDTGAITGLATDISVDNKIGILTDLQTTNQTNLVGAVNEVTTRFSETVTGIYNARLNGLAGNGSTNDYPSLNSTLATIGGSSATIFFESGTYKISSNITIPSNVTLWFLNGAMISPDSGVTVTINGSIEAGLYTIFTGLGVISGKIKTPVVFPEWFGAKGDGTTNDSSAIQKAINTGAHVRLSQNTYNIGSTGLTKVRGLTGVGKSLTKLTYDGSTTIAISVINESWEIRGLSIEHTGTRSSGSAIDITTGSYGTLESVFIRNGVNGISITNSQSIKIHDIEVWGFIGYGLLFNGGNNDIFVSKVFINGQTVSGTVGNGTGIRLFNKAEAITFDSIEVVLCSYALNTDATVNSNGNRPGYCRFTNSFFDSSTNGVLIDKVVNFHFNQCWFSNRPNNGCVVNSGDDIVFSQCSFVNNAQHGCLVQSASKRVKFLGCSFISNSATTSNTSYGLIFGGGSTDFIVKDCTATNGLGFPSTQRTGIIVADGASDRYIIADNLVNGNLTSSVADGGTGTNKRVANNY